jgi:hypothetical protein
MSEAHVFFPLFLTQLGKCPRGDACAMSHSVSRQGLRSMQRQHASAAAALLYSLSLPVGGLHRKMRTVAVRQGLLHQRGRVLDRVLVPPTFSCVVVHAATSVSAGF